MKKKILIIISFIILTLIIFLIYKNNTFKMYYNYNNNYKLSNETITINKRDYKNKLNYNNITIENIFKKYELDDDTYILEINDEIEEMFYVDYADTYIDIFINGISSYESKNDDLINKEDRERIIKDNNITNDIDLINYMINYMSKELNMFSSIKELKTYAYINKYLSSVLPLLDYYIEINGDYKGILLYELNMEYETSILVNLYLNNKRYLLSFIGKSLTEDDIIKLIGTVVLNEE